MSFVIPSIEDLQVTIQSEVSRAMQVAIAAGKGIEKDGDVWLTLSEAAAYIGFSKQTIHKWINEGRAKQKRRMKLKAFRVGDDIRVKKSDLLAFGDYFS